MHSSKLGKGPEKRAPSYSIVYQPCLIPSMSDLCNKGRPLDARSCIASPFGETQAFMAPAREPNPIWNVICADRRHQGCQYGDRGPRYVTDFRAAPGQALACQCLDTWGVGTQSTMADCEIIPTKMRFLRCWHRYPAFGAEAAAPPVENSRIIAAQGPEASVFHWSELCTRVVSHICIKLLTPNGGGSIAETRI
jgi:hypothetical protein